MAEWPKYDTEAVRPFTTGVVMPTTTEDRIRILRVRMRKAQAQATAADVTWNELNDAFKVKHGREQTVRESSGREPKSDLVMASEKTDSLALKDAFAVQAWWRAQAQYLATLLQAEVQAAQYLREVER